MFNRQLRRKVNWVKGHLTSYFLFDLMVNHRANWDQHMGYEPLKGVMLYNDDVMIPFDIAPDFSPKDWQAIVKKLRLEGYWLSISERTQSLDIRVELVPRRL